jgi:hypothetical protein
MSTGYDRISRQKMSAKKPNGAGKIRISLWSTNVSGGGSIEATIEEMIEETK